MDIRDGKGAYQNLPQPPMYLVVWSAELLCRQELEYLAVPGKLLVSCHTMLDRGWVLSLW